ncbi:class I SAM-dependent methyltransferase [Amycolatopsis suaedae]|uniref:Class I SAM-dependent methyltransferase n=2 Tax=Amycolatopsis suaedae TaxID=2510978 RepID=A0A4Q7JEX5_9PSEU|nr:class I SAM-dependent methyltransferase [Amycolatopsis suaedae]
MRPQLDDVEAEITYLLLRHERPDLVTEIGSRGGWSTTWILRALADNGAGRLLTMDLDASALMTVPPEVAGRRWEFRKGDVRALPADWITATDYLFVDADHRQRFARWYLTTVFPSLRPGIAVSVHDVFRRARPWPLSEGAEVLRALAGRSIGYFTVAPARASLAYERIAALRRELGLAEPVRTGVRNPMIYFRMPAGW